MKIALVYTLAPFIRGGSEILVEDLCYELEQLGHIVDVFNLPSPQDVTLPLLNTLYSYRSLRFDGYDKVIAHKFPAYCVKHPNKVIWMFHQFRQIYELWGTEYSFQINSHTSAIKSIFKNADDKFIKEAKKNYTNAKEVNTRLMNYNSIEATVLNPPLKNSERYNCAEVGDYIFMPARIAFMKRQHLLVEAMRYVKSGVKLILAGNPEDDTYLHEMLSSIKRYSLQDKVQIISRYVSDEEKIDMLSTSLGVAYIPYKEDSCGFVTMEGFYSKKPVISCTDSGGTYEFIRDRYSGYFADPTPESIAAAMDKLYNDKANAKLMGENGYKFIVEKNITWKSTIERLLS